MTALASLGLLNTVRRRGRIFLLALVMASCSLCAGAQAEQITAVTEELAPFNYTVDGKLEGYSVQAATELLKRSRYSYEMHAYPWARAYQMALEQPNVLIFTMARTPEREDLFQWIGPLAKRRLYLYKLASRKDIVVSDLEGASKYVVAANRGDATEKFLISRGFTVGKNIDESPDQLASIHKLFAGHVDFIVGTDFLVAYVAKQAGLPIQSIERVLLLTDSGEYFLAMSKSTSPAVVQRMRTTYDEMQKEGYIKHLRSGFQLPGQ